MLGETFSERSLVFGVIFIKLNLLSCGFLLSICRVTRQKRRSSKGHCSIVLSFDSIHFVQKNYIKTFFYQKRKNMKKTKTLRWKYFQGLALLSFVTAVHERMSLDKEHLVHFILSISHPTFDWSYWLKISYCPIAYWLWKNPETSPKLCVISC